MACILLASWTMGLLMPMGRRFYSLLAEHAAAVRVLLVLGCLMLLCRWQGWATEAIPLTLGVIASALAETDDSWHGRLRAQCITLVCFALIAFGVEWLFAYPLAFIAAFALAAFVLSMVAAVGTRYKALAYATLILGMYTTLSAEQAQALGWIGWRWQEPALLLVGAAAFGVVSVLWCALFPAQPVQAMLVQLYEVLGDYVHYKASLFEPLRDVDVNGRRLALAQRNAAVVSALNEVKEALFSRFGRRAPSARLARYRGLYLIAQDVHERASSSHEAYEDLAQAFFHSDLLYRCQRVLSLQGAACHRLAESIARREPYVMDAKSTQALAELRSAIEHARGRDLSLSAQQLLASVVALSRNLEHLQAQLAGASHTAHPAARLGRVDLSLHDRTPRGWRDAWARIQRQCTVRSPLFRHSVRLALALAVGFAVIKAFALPHGYWIMLTTLFVCQPSYGATVARMGQRITGTVLGVVCGWALTELFPQMWVQTLLSISAAVLFFALRHTRYLWATACMTLLVLLSFHQVMDSASLIVPRLIDTAIGSVIAGLAVLLVLPHWQARRMHEVAGQALQQHAGYLAAITAQYRGQVGDTLAYRLARRNAHNADAALSVAVTEMLREPDFTRPAADAALRYLVQSHTLLNYLSALGAHRELIRVPLDAEILEQAAHCAVRALQEAGAALAMGQIPPTSGLASVGVQAALARFDAADQSSEKELDLADAALRALMRTQLRLIGLQIDQLMDGARALLAAHNKVSCEADRDNNMSAN